MIKRNIVLLIYPLNFAANKIAGNFPGEVLRACFTPAQNINLIINLSANFNFNPQ